MSTTTTTHPIAQRGVAKTPGSAVTVTSSSTVIAAANNARAEITISNTDATGIIYLSLGGTAVVGSGIRLQPAGGSYTTGVFSGAINGISSIASQSVGVSEI